MCVQVQEYVPDVRAGLAELHRALRPGGRVAGVGHRLGDALGCGSVPVVQALQAKEINRIILTRPAVEAGERLGFLPGDILAKVDPYLRPLYDALYDMLEPEVVSRLMERGTIEVAPLAFMRGRTLNDSFIILDEAQNTTPEQMKMFLTRLGFGSKIVVTGDVTQIDLPEGRGRSGLLAVRESSTVSPTSRSSSSTPTTSCATRSSRTS